MLEIGFKNTYFQVFQGFPTLKETVAHIQPNGQFWTEKNAKNLYFWAFWPKMANFGQFLAKMAEMGIFFQKAFGTFFSLLKALINCKVSEKSNEGIPRKMQKTSICGHFGQKWPILDSFWPKWAKQDFFSKKRLEHFFRLYKP